MSKEQTLEETITDEHVSLNLIEKLEDALPGLLHDMTDTANAVKASADYVRYIYCGTSTPQVDLLLEYIEHTKKSLDEAASHIRTAQEQLRTDRKNQEMTPAKKYQLIFKAIIECSRPVRDYIANARSIHLRDQLHILQEPADECLSGAAKGYRQFLFLATRASKILTEDLPYISERTDIAETVQDAADICSGQLKLYQINLRIRRHQDNGEQGRLYFQGDPRRMTQVIMNLLSNMMYELKDEKEPLIEITTRRCPGKEGYARLDIENNGPPIEDTEKIFEKGKSGRQSSGLGLPICRHIVSKKFGGSIYADNTPTGVAFYIEIPTVP